MTVNEIVVVYVDTKEVQRIRHGCAKRERHHAPHASRAEQARRIRPSTSPPAPKQCSQKAACAQVDVNLMRSARRCFHQERQC